MFEPKEGESGLDRCTEALESLYGGQNIGKTCVECCLVGPRLICRLIKVSLNADDKSKL